MSDLEFRTEPRVQLLCCMGDDRTVAQRARVSTGRESGDPARDAGLVRRLITDRHGSPFEHVVFTHDVETSIFVAREFLRHRIASYSEASLRYMEGKPVVYVPGPERQLVSGGGAQMNYGTGPGDDNQRNQVDVEFHWACDTAWESYQVMLRRGVLREVARGVLPLCFGTHFQVTWNLRSVLNFLSLRVHDPSADRPSHPQYEIEQVARIIEATVARRVPVAYESFMANGRRTP